MSKAFEALAEPNRRHIVEALAEGERPVGDLVELLGVSQPTVSKHLRVLRDAGLVESRSDSQRRLYRLRPEPFQEIDDWLAPFRERWAESLDRLERHLDDIDTRGRADRTQGDRPQGDRLQDDRNQDRSGTDRAGARRRSR